MAEDFRSSADGLAVKAAKASGKQQSVEKYQADDDGSQGKMWKLGNHRGAKAFAGVDKGIHEHCFLEDGEFFQRAPGIVGATEENHRRDDEAEHEADVRLLHAAPEREAAGGGERSDEHGHNLKEQGVRHVQC